MKFSIIICSYNGEKYIDKCINSIINQTYKNYEIIFVNDGSKDNTKLVISKYKNIKIINKENTGLSDSRNKGVNLASGDYILFLDIDDTLELNTLEVLNNNLTKDIDIIKFSSNLIYEDSINKIITNYPSNIMSGNEAIKLLIESKTVFEMAQLYAYKKEYWINNNYLFTKGRYHEDFGLIPYVILRAKNVKLLNDNLYNYLQTDNSITRNNDYGKTIKRFNDVLYFYKEYINKLDDIDIKTKKVFLSFISNAVLLQYSKLNNSDKKKYKKVIKENRVIDNLLDDTIFRKLKKIKIKITL